MKVDYAARARVLVGTRFRAQGRGEAGLDCVGVVLATFGIAADAVRRDYRLTGNALSEVEASMRAHFRKVAKGQARPGDVLLLDAGEGQLHLAVRTVGGFVHAHAGIRRVVEAPGAPVWPILGVYRKRQAR